MEIVKKKDEKTLSIVLLGRLDTTTAPALESAVKEDIADITLLELDFAGLEYISSAGLRVLLSFQKQMNLQGEMIIRNVRPEVMDVFEITGFADILTIK